MIQGHIGATDINQQYDISRDLPTVKKYFEQLLRIFNYIDFGMMFFIDTDKNYSDVFETGFAEYVQHLKKQGDIKHIGFSSHNPITAKRVIDTGLPEMLMFSINPAFDMLPSEEDVFDHFDEDLGTNLFKGVDPIRAQFYKYCELKQIGITVMKTLGVGKLISKEHTPFDKPMTVPQCVHYSLTRPAVACILPGCQTAAEVHDIMTYFETTDSERDYTQILNSKRNDFKGSCVYCSHCQPCPAEIDIATVNRLLDTARLDKNNIPPSIKAQYQNLKHKGDECHECGQCEERCPFDVEIITSMSEAAMLS